MTLPQRLILMLLNLIHLPGYVLRRKREPFGGRFENGGLVQKETINKIL